MNLVDWLKNLVSERRSEEVVDAKILEKPSSKALKRALLVALRCVDPDALKRPRMGHVIHMLEMEDLLFREVYFNAAPFNLFVNTPTLAILIPCRIENMGERHLIISARLPF